MTDTTRTRSVEETRLLERACQRLPGGVLGSDGMYPLLTNDPTLTPAQVLEAHKGQPTPERELRTAMRRARIAELPLYPEARRCKRPTTDQLLRLFSHAERHLLLRHDRPLQVFHPELTDLQQQVLTLLGVPPRAFRT